MASLIGGGSHLSSVNNCIIWDNSASTGMNFYNATISYSCSYPLPPGTGNFTNNPVLLSASHISPSSPCIGAGTNTYVTGTDIDGENWKTPPSVGCDEVYLTNLTGELFVNIYAKYTSAVVGVDLIFRAIIDGKPVSNHWSFSDGYSSADKYLVNHFFPVAGEYEVILTVFNNDNPAGISATVTVNIVEINDATYYVNKANMTPESPYNSWSTAATNIQDAVNIALQTQTKHLLVLVTDGIYDTGGDVTPGYSSSNRVVITKDIIVKSVNGPENTIIFGKRPLGDGAVRGVYMSSGILDGFTVSNGHTRMWPSGYDYYEQCGGGVNMYGGNAMITNCIISGNSAYVDGGGICFGTVNNCTISGNTTQDQGGGICYSTVNNCTISGNTAYMGGGTYESIVNNCTISGNSAYNYGGTYYGTVNNCTINGNSANNLSGGTCGGTVNNCTISGNSAGRYGGGTFYGTVNNCIISRNSAGYGGGGTAYGTVNDCAISGNLSNNKGGGTYDSIVNNCSISGNSAYNGGGTYDGSVNNCIIIENSAGYGGGTCFGTVNNCTITGNAVTNSGGGTFYGTVNNCIIWDNTAPESTNYSDSIISYSCSYPLPSGTGNISNNPQFISATDFHLQATSPCRDAGTNAYAPMPWDLDGNPRIIDGTVDMGAYEFVPEPVGIWIIGLLELWIIVKRSPRVCRGIK